MESKLTGFWLTKFEKLTLKSSVNQNLGGHTFKIARPKNYGIFMLPYIYIDEDTGKYSGSDYDLIAYLSQALNFNLEWVETIDGQWGSLTPNGSWTGMIGMAQRQVSWLSPNDTILLTLIQDVDMAIGGISITPSRYESVDFSWPYTMDSILTFFTRQPPPYPQYLGLVWPFSNLVWLTFFVSFILYGLGAILVLKIWPSQRSGRAGLDVFSTLLKICLEQCE